VNYYGGFEREDLDQIFEAVRSNYKAWCSAFALLIVGGDMESITVREFSRTRFNMRPDIAICLAQTKFLSDMRHILGLVIVPCHVIVNTKHEGLGCAGGSVGVFASESWW
jgi:hypothetical protein